MNLDYLPPPVLRAQLTEIERCLDTTSFHLDRSRGDVDRFCYRIQSPVVMIEFDHKSGVLLTNQDPNQCHTHTVVRTPNANDFGRDLLRLHHEQRQQLRFEPPVQFIPFSAWTRMTAGPFALTFRDKTNLLDLSGGAKIRWATKTSGFHVVRPVIKLADGRMFVGRDDGGQ